MPKKISWLFSVDKQLGAGFPFRQHYYWPKIHLSQRAPPNIWEKRRLETLPGCFGSLWNYFHFLCHSAVSAGCHLANFCTKMIRSCGAVKRFWCRGSLWAGPKHAAARLLKLPPGGREQPSRRGSLARHGSHRHKWGPERAFLKLDKPVLKLLNGQQATGQLQSRPDNERLVCKQDWTRMSDGFHSQREAEGLMRACVGGIAWQALQVEGLGLRWER